MKTFVTRRIFLAHREFIIEMAFIFLSTLFFLSFQIDNIFIRLRFICKVFENFLHFHIQSLKRETPILRVSSILFHAFVYGIFPSLQHKVRRIELKTYFFIGFDF